MIKPRRTNPGPYLRSQSEMLAYLDAIVEPGQPSQLVSALNEIARGRNMSELARECGLSRIGLYKALAPGGNPGFLTIAKVAQALGLRIAIAPQNREANS